MLNDQLRKGQAGAEREAKSQQVASSATRAELQKVSERLKAMPRRFTQSLSQLRDEVDKLESEKLSLGLEKQQRTLKVIAHDYLYWREVCFCRPYLLFSLKQNGGPHRLELKPIASAEHIWLFSYQLKL